MAYYYRERVSPWIESLIQSYGSGEEGIDKVSPVKAYVTGVGEIPESQVHNPEDPTGLLFLSDGVLQIPTILTHAAWEQIQEQEDRDCFSGFPGTIVCIARYKLLFCMAPEQINCKFLLLVGGMASLAVSSVRVRSPCYTTCPSVRSIINKRWRQQMIDERLNSQDSDAGFTLTELLSEWENDCLQKMADDVRALITGQSQPEGQQPAATKWDMERVQYKGEAPFSVPVKYLLMPEEGEVNEVKLEVPGSPSGEASLLLEDRFLARADSDINPLLNPWDLFQPPSSSSSDKTPDCSPQSPMSDCPASSTSYQSSKIEQSFLTPYQKPRSGEKKDTDMQREQERISLEAKRKTMKSMDEDAITSEDKEVSPPSKLFYLQGSGVDEDRVTPQSQTTGTRQKASLEVHADGKPFSYRYQVSQQSLEDLSCFRVSDAQLSWAVRHLLAPQVRDHPKPQHADTGKL